MQRDPPPADLLPVVLPAAWVEFLDQQRLVNENFSRRDKEEIRTLLLACQRPPEIQSDLKFLADRLKLYLVVANRGWSSALTALPDWELAQLGVSLPPAPPQVHYVQQQPTYYQNQQQQDAPTGPSCRRRKPAKKTAAPSS